MRLLYCDLETFSTTPISHGSHRYAEDAEVMLWAYAFDDEETDVWDLTSGEPMPDELREGLEDPSVMTVWHNGTSFDTVVLSKVMGINIPSDRLHDTMVQALTHGLPGALGTLCEIFQINSDEAKDKEGKRLIQLFCKPRPKSSKVRRATSHTHPEDWERFKQYAGKDITSMRALYKAMPNFNYTLGTKERELWALDRNINLRGITIDTDLVNAALETVDKEKALLAEKSKEMTGGEVASATQRDALLGHILSTYGVTLPDLTGDTLERRISDPELPEALRELLLVRQQATTTSTAKYASLQRGVSSDGRLRGTLQFCGASRTGRWAGRLFQPQNLPRPALKQKDIDLGIDAFKKGCADLVSDNVMQLASSCIRGCLIASPGHTLVVSDLSNIEGRVAAWLAGEDWKLDAFRAYDNGTGHDLYAVAYARAFNVTPESVMENKKSGNGIQRQIGKVMELMLQYGGGVGAFITGAASYGIDLEQLAATAWPNIPDRVKAEALQYWEIVVKEKKTLGLSKEAFTTCDALKRLWREAHPKISSYWKELENVLADAITIPNKVFRARKIVVARQGNWLFIKLPSGRRLCYAAPAVDGGLSYMGINQYSRKWSKLNTYGGKILENITQAVARDVMAEAMLLVGHKGFDILLTVHDELITEQHTSVSVPEEFSNEKDPRAEWLSSLLATNPSWAPDLPLSAGGFSAARYRKD